MRWTKLWVASLGFVLVGCGSAQAKSTLSRPPVTSQSPASSPPSSAATKAGAVVMTVPATNKSSQIVTISVNTSSGNSSQVQTLKSELTQLNQLLQTLQHP